MSETTPAENLATFRAMVLCDPALLEQLRAATDVMTFSALMVRLGQDYCCSFTHDDVADALRAARREWMERWI